ncbi:hypothetical protein BUALT_Bualt16G0049800 [Buddleja alternifolia]|uniref:Uncharacterized protein n=1 Tax=Buddleja alternifolia TaxID=168488 RepID=A0AAV6WHJ6_9LAMI|nr:hypothetical protein BUALT_Bualt16G0049800 [Buddleja alternifolia]
MNSGTDFFVYDDDYANNNEGTEGDIYVPTDSHDDSVIGSQFETPVSIEEKTMSEINFVNLREQKMHMDMEACKIKDEKIQAEILTQDERRYSITQEAATQIMKEEIQTQCIGFKGTTRDNKWRGSMDEEIKSIRKNNTWELGTLPKGKTTIGVKWMCKTKKILMAK